MSLENEEKKETSIRFCGLGGMGVILVSVILGKAAIYDSKNAIQTQSYGAEQRGTKVRSDVIISDSDVITYPVVDNADILVAFSKDAFDFYYSSTHQDSQIFINSDLIHTQKKDKKIIQIPASNLAKELKNERITNIIMLGALISHINLLSKESIIKSIRDTIPEKYQELNIKAFDIGFSYKNQVWKLVKEKGGSLLIS